ncbi:MAG: T9SS type A sorting domain-containing protein [Ignavibacteriae bacterium]|nr:T9SS type A sorting domain-containing protein [Ignavibacteriota bacterium]
MFFARRLFSLVVCLTLSYATLHAQSSITAVRMPAAVAGTGGSGTVGYPYAVFVRIQNWTAGASGQAFVKFYNSTNNEYMWSATGVWSNASAYNNANQPVVSVDAGGNWSGWIYAKHNDALGVTVAVRAAKVGATSTNLTSSQMTLNVLSMTSGGTGGWIVRATSPAVNKGIVAYSGGNIVGTYRTEDNAIVEGYSYGAGGFKIAVPAGFVDSLVTFNDDGSRDQAFVGPWAITAGQETDASTSGGQVGRGSASLLPSTLSGGASHSVTIKVAGQTPYALVRTRIAVPSSWSWSRSVADLIVSGGGSPTVAVAGDTVVVSNTNVAGGDTLRVQISNITPADTTAYFVFNVKTGTHPDSVYPIGTQPSIFIYSTPLSLSAVQQNDANGVPLRNNTLVTVRGIVTVANQFGGPSYIQDNSGGLAIFGSSFSTAASIGDEVIVSGLVQPFNGLTEIVNPTLHSIASSGNVVTPMIVAASQIANDGVGGVEQYECRLVRLNNVTVASAGTWTGNTNYTLTDASGSTQLRIDDPVNLIGTPIPGGSFDIIGVVGQFISPAPYIGGYQLLPRFVADQITTGPIIASAPTESTILPTALTITWTTLHNGTSGVRYGRTSALELGAVTNSILQTSHSIALTTLLPATAYYIQAFSASGSDTSFAATFLASTASPAQSTGAVNAYFNKSVNTSLAWYQPALGNQNLPQRLIARIASAKRSIDLAVYSLSGQPGTDIASALVAAKNRGVKVRAICEDDNKNSAALTFLSSNGVPLISDKFDAINNGAGLMHNKFFVIDGRGGAPESVWVWTGSWNPTDPGTNADFQNAIEFQDAALTNAFTIEFNEMWGSSGETPVGANSRFGARKTNNTPHKFVIGGKPVEAYFSPSDGADARIVDEINRAEHSVGFQLLTLTRSGIATALRNKKNAGKKVRGNLDDSTDTGSQYRVLVNNGVDVRLKSSGTSGLLHHKYGIIDAENPIWNAVTLTGSHNWTSSAENANNENMMIVRDGNIANQYLQEFAARYYQFGGADSILVGVEEQPGVIAQEFSLGQNYPNPFNPSTNIRFTIQNHAEGIPSGQFTILKVYDVLGREVATLVNEQLKSGEYKVSFDGGNFASGLYFYRLEAGAFRQTKKFMLVK